MKTYKPIICSDSRCETGRGCSAYFSYKEQVCGSSSVSTPSGPAQTSDAGLPKEMITLENAKFTLICDDCVTAMQKLESSSIDFLFTDPPYGSTRCRWDSPLDLDAFWNEANRIVKPNGCKAIFAQTPFDKVLGCSNLSQLRY